MVDDQRRVVPPLVGVGDFGGELVQLSQRAFPGLRGHPVQVADADPVGLAEIGDQRIDAGLGVRREMALDVKLSDGVAQQILHQTDSALPALTDLLGAGERAAIEREVLGDQGVGEEPGSRVDQPPPGPAFPVVEILAAP